jgi:hypothetical protein
VMHDVSYVEFLNTSDVWNGPSTLLPRCHIITDFIQNISGFQLYYVLANSLNSVLSRAKEEFVGKWMCNYVRKTNLYQQEFNIVTNNYIYKLSSKDHFRFHIIRKS